MKKEIVFVSLIVACAGARVAFGGLLYEPSCYVAQESLALNLDGIRNVGALKAHDGAATEWKDLSHTANNAEFIAKEGDASAWTADGYHFAGGCYGKLKSAQDFGDAVTVQIVADVTRSDSTTTWPSLFGNWNDRLNIYCNGNDVLFKADHSTGLSWTSRSKLTSWGGKYLNAALDAVAYKQILVQTASFQTGWVEGSKSEKASVGSQQWSFGSAGNGGNFDQSNLDARYLVGTIKAIRVYKKVLSNTELAANRAIDEARFFAGIPVTNVVVATAVPGVEGNESAGAYAYDESGHTFTAPQRMAKDGVSYVCTGYTLERRNGTAWGPAQLFAGTAYTSADTNACVRLTWQWRATGGVGSADLDPLLDDYVTDGLLLHVDGIRNVGADKPHDNAASAWVDLVGGKVAPFYHDADDGSAWREDGYYFGGTSFAQFTAQMTGLTNTVTVQVVCDTIPSQLKRTVKWPNLVGCNDNDACNVYYTAGGQLTFKNANGGNVFLSPDAWLGHYATAIRAGTTNYVTQGTTLAGAVKNETNKGNISASATVRIGSAGSSLSLRQDRWFTGVIKAVRIYDRVLTDEELEQNRAIDEVRFFGAALPVTNVVVASSVRGISGDAPEGAYMLSAGGHTFSAPATMTSGDDTYSCTGYTLETWDDATGMWSAPVSYASSSYNATDLTAKVRLTWQWTHTAGPGFDAAFNDYVTDGLVIHLDGIRNTGLAPIHDGTAETWADLSDSGGYAHIIHNADDGSAWAADGYTLGGKEYYGGRSYVQMNGTRTLDGPYTIQEVLDFDRDRANRINVPWPGLMGTTDTGDKLAYYYNMPNVGTPDVRLKVMNTYLYQISGWGGDYVTAIFNGTQTASFKGATTEGVTWKDFTYVPGTRTFTFGSGNGSGSGYADRYLTGTIKGVRFYNRALTDTELARNRAADEIRFFGRAPAATGELVVASDVKGLIGNQPCGMYRPAGAYTFTAPAEAWLDGTPYECSGYTLETWDGSAWGSPVSYDSCSYLADLSAASRRLTWNWRVKSRLTRVRSDYDVDDYVQTDLYLHLDGIRNAGATADHDAAATTWADLANGNDATFDFANAGVTGDGWTDNGYRFVYGGKFAGLPETLNFGSVVTIQAVCDVGKSGKTSGSSWQMLFGATNDFFNVYTGDGNGNTIVFKIFNNQAQVKDTNNVITTYTGGRQQMSGTWTGKYVTAIWSAGKYTVFQDAVPDSGRWAGTWRYNWEALTGRPFYVGGVYFPESAGETNNRRLTGTIHALRVYKRALSDAELEHNRIVDEARFFGNLPESNVVVVDAGGEQAESGIYKVDGTWTFTATTARGDNNEVKPVKGYTLDMWDGSAWIRAASGQGDSYTYTVGTSPAKVRLTWNALPSGTVLIVR